MTRKKSPPTAAGRREAAAQLLGRNHTPTEVGKLLGVRREEVSRWRADPDFAAAERAERERFLGGLAAADQAAYLEATQYLLTVLRSDKASTGQRMQAAQELRRPRRGSEDTGPPGPTQTHLLVQTTVRSPTEGKAFLRACIDEVRKEVAGG